MVLIALVGAEACRVILGPNFHVVVPGHCYRSAQPTATFLSDVVRSRGIRTVINLRGYNPHDPIIHDEADAALGLGICMVHVRMTAHFKSEEKELCNLLDALEACPEPILLHCGQGADRTGFAAACYLLLKTPATLEEAKGQLALRYGHFPVGRTTCQDNLLRDYGEWLQSQELTHAPQHFQTWAREVYVKDDWQP